MTDWAGDDKGAVAAPSRLAQALDTKTKGHIALAMALRCDDRIAFHVKAALQQGTPREEVTEVLRMAIYMGVGPPVMYASPAIDAFQQFGLAAKPDSCDA